MPRIVTARAALEAREALDTTAAAAPSEIGEHIGMVRGHTTARAASTSSTVNDFWNCALGLCTEWAWFLALTAANCSRAAARLPSTSYIGSKKAAIAASHCFRCRPAVATAASHPLGAPLNTVRAPASSAVLDRFSAVFAYPRSALLPNPCVARAPSSVPPLLQRVDNCETSPAGQDGLAGIEPAELQ